MNPLLHLIKEQEEEFKNSEPCERINSTELCAINHGFPQWKGITITSFHRTSIIAILEKLVEGMERKMFKRPSEAGQFAIHAMGFNKALNEQISELKETINQLKEIK